MPDALDRAVLVPREFSKKRTSDDLRSSQDNAVHQDSIAQASNHDENASPSSVAEGTSTT